MADTLKTRGTKLAPAQSRTLINNAWEALFSAQATVFKRLQRDDVFNEVSSREYDVLYHLSKRPESWTKLSELNKRVLLTQPSISRLVDRLVNRDLVRRKPDVDDRRGVLLQLTDDGLELQRRVGRLHLNDIVDIVGPALTESELARLTTLANKLRANVLDQN